MSQGTALYLFLYNWAKRILITEAGLPVTIKESHQNTSMPSGLSVFIKYAPDRTKTGSYSAGDVNDLATAHRYGPDFGITDVNTTTNIITITGHSFNDNDLVSFTTTNTLPDGLSANTYYHIITVATNTFQVSATQAGSTINITDVGIGTHTITREGQRTLINDYVFKVELWEINGTGETLRLLIDSIDRQEIKDLWSSSAYSLFSTETIQILPRLPQNKWKKEAMLELTIGAAEATLETPGFIEDAEITGTIIAQGRAGDHTITI